MQEKSLKSRRYSESIVSGRLHQNSDLESIASGRLHQNSDLEARECGKIC